MFKLVFSVSVSAAKMLTMLTRDLRTIVNVPKERNAHFLWITYERCQFLFVLNFFV